MTREQKLKKALNIKRNNLSKRRKVENGKIFVRDLGLAFITVTAKNSGQFIGYMKTYYGR